MTEHDVYVLTADEESFCNPDETVLLFATLEEASAHAREVTMREVADELVGDSQYTIPPLEPGAEENVVVKVHRDPEADRLWIVAVWLDDDDRRNAHRYRDFYAWQRTCPIG